MFSSDTKLYGHTLGEFSWSNSEDPDQLRDNAEQSFRILNAYIQINDPK